MSLHDVTYQHWEGEHHGIWRRRWVIAENGLRSCLDNKWARHLLLVSWFLCLVQVAVLFVVGQLLVKDSVVYGLVDQLESQWAFLASGLVSWLVDHPEISVRTTYNILFYFFASHLGFLAMIAIVMVIPHLITRDLSSQAIIIYSSKAVSRFDYILGKFGTVFGLLCLIWLGPLVTAWIAGNFLSSDWSFFWHSRIALINTLIYVLTAMTILSIVSLGISSLSKKPKATTFFWVVLWLVGNAIRAFGESGRNPKEYLRNFSISFNLDQISLAVFNLSEELQLAQDAIPVLGDMLRGLRNSPFNWFEKPDMGGTSIALTIMVVTAIFILRFRVKPE